MSSAAALPAASLRRDWPPRFQPVLSKLTADGLRYFGHAAVSVEPIRLVDRPFSTLLQIRVSGARRFGEAFVKILKPRSNTPDQIASMRRNVLEDFEMTRRVHTRLAAYPGLTAVRPIACFPEDLAIVTEDAPGDTLATLLSRRAAGVPRETTVDELATVLRQVGSWLSAAQAVLSEDGDVKIDALRAYLDRRLDDLEQHGQFRLSRTGRAAIERYRDRLMSALGAELPSGWIHADFCPENIIAGDGTITVLDFTMAKRGTIYHDVAHLYLQLDAMTSKPWFTSRVIGRCQRELLHAFEPGLDPERPLFALMLLQHVICHLVELQAPKGSPIARLYASRLHRRHRDWLTRVASLDERSWVR